MSYRKVLAMTSFAAGYIAALLVNGQDAPTVVFVVRLVIFAVFLSFTVFSATREIAR